MCALAKGGIESCRLWPSSIMRVHVLRFCIATHMLFQVTPNCGKSFPSRVGVLTVLGADLTKHKNSDSSGVP
eukprot:4819490-Amphidinium_carterae.1